MPYLAGGVSGGLGGAATGASIGSLFPGPGTAIGAVVGGLAGFLAGRSGRSPEEERQERRRQLLAQINEARRRAISDITRQTIAEMASARQAAARRALSLGRETDAESFILPAESRIAETGTEALRATQRLYDQELIGAEREFAGRPIEPGIGDYLAEIGSSALAFKQDQDLLNLYRDAYGVGGRQRNVTAQGRMPDLFETNYLSPNQLFPRSYLGYERPRQLELPRINPRF